MVSHLRNVSSLTGCRGCCRNLWTGMHTITPVEILQSTTWSYAILLLKFLLYSHIYKLLNTELTPGLSLKEACFNFSTAGREAMTITDRRCSARWSKNIYQVWNWSNSFCLCRCLLERWQSAAICRRSALAAESLWWCSGESWDPLETQTQAE